MNPENKIEEIKNLLSNIDNRDVRKRISSALDCLRDQSRLPVVTNAINRARKTGYVEIALKLANLAYELYPNNSFFLVELCSILNLQAKNQAVIDKISEFRSRVDLDSLRQKERDMIAVTLASAYKGLGNVLEGIRILEELRSNSPPVLEELAEQYYKEGRPEKTIELLENKKDLTKDMALWLGKSYGSKYQWVKAKEVLKPFLSAPEIKDYFQVVEMKTADRSESARETRPTGAPNPKKVFVVHGRNETARRSLFDFLRAIGLQPIEWSQALQLTGKASPYIGEVLDSAFSIAQAVLVLLTGDDEAKLRYPYLKDDDPDFEKNLTPQARPNVLFEAGMAFGRCSERTILISLGSLRPFSDIAGRHMIRLNNSAQKRHELALRLQTAGCEVDLTGTDWHSAGNFEIDE